MDEKECKKKIYKILSGKFCVRLKDNKNDDIHFADQPFNFSEIQLAQFFFEVEALFRINFKEEDLINEKFTTINNVTALILSAT